MERGREYWARRASQEKARAAEAGCEAHRAARIELSEIFLARAGRHAPDDAEPPPGQG